MIAVNSTWRHAEGNAVRIASVGDDWVEPHGCGRWSLADFSREWTQVPDEVPGQSPPVSASSYDDGYRRGAIDTCERLMQIINQHGLVPLTVDKIETIEAQLLQLARKVTDGS